LKKSGLHHPLVASLPDPSSAEQRRGNVHAKSYIVVQFVNWKKNFSPPGQEEYSRLAVREVVDYPEKFLRIFPVSDSD